MNQIVTFTSVEEKKRGNNKRGPWILRLFTAAGGEKFQTFDVDLGDKLTGLLNQPVEVEYEIEDNGNFKNNVIKSAGVRSATARYLVSHVKAADPGAVPVAVNGGSAPSSQDEFRRSKEEMRRTEAVKAAATIIASPNWSGEVNLEALGALAEQVGALIANDEVSFGG